MAYLAAVQVVCVGTVVGFLSSEGVDGELLALEQRRAGAPVCDAQKR